MSINEKSYSILQVLPHLNSGGLVRGALEIAKALSLESHTSYVASSGGQKLNDIIRTKTECIRLPLNTKNPIRIYRNIYHLAKLVRKYNIDIVHARSRAPAWSAKFAAKKMNVPFVTTFHGTYGLENNLKKKYNSIMANSDRVIAISNFIASHIKKEYGIDSGKISIIPRGVDLSLFDPLVVKDSKLYEIENKYDLKSGLHTILLPGRMTRWKGHELFIDAISMLKRDDIICMFVGDIQGKSRYVQQLQKKIKKLGLQNQFRFLGNQNNMPAIYKLADVVVSASTKPEAFGRVVAEAQAMGRLTIAVNHGGSPEIIKNQKTGWLFKKGNAKELSKKILSALSMSQEERINISERSIRFIKDNYDMKFMCERTLKLYSELIHEKKNNFPF